MHHDRALRPGRDRRSRRLSGRSELADADTARVVQLSDTHLSQRVGVPATLALLLEWIRSDPPDLVLVTGDIVAADPDDDADREFARRVFDDLPCPLLAIPGNHDVGFYGEEDALADRIDKYVAAWGSDRFAVDVAGWRLVGVNAYLLGDAEHDRWLGAQVATDRPLAVFVHQPIEGDAIDGWEMPEHARAAFVQAAGGAGIRLLAHGHRHRSYDGGTVVWAPSTTYDGQTASNSPETDPRPGAVEYTFARDGTFTTRFVRP